MSVNTKFSKPSFEDLHGAYNTDSQSVHACKIIDPDKVNTCAARMSEALLIANGIVKDRGEIANTGTGKQADATNYLLGAYGFGTYANTGNLCTHGVGRGAQDLGVFLKYHWGTRTKGWTKQASHTTAPAEIIGKKGLVLYMKIPESPNVQGHIDLWNDTGPVGSQYWGSDTIWFWELA